MIMNVISNKWFGPAVVVVMLIISALTYNGLPEEMPAQWGVDGEVNSTMSRELSVLLLPGMTLGLWYLLRLVPNIDPRRASYAEFAPTYHRFIAGFVAYMALLHAVIHLAYDQSDVVIRTLMVGMGLLFALLGNELGRVRPTWFVGIRTPWTLSSDSVWRRTHRVGGRLFFGTGIATALASVVLPLDFVVIFFTGAIVVVTVFAIAYSYWLWRQEAGESHSDPVI